MTQLNKTQKFFNRTFNRPVKRRGMQILLTHKSLFFRRRFLFGHAKTSKWHKFETHTQYDLESFTSRHSITLFDNQFFRGLKGKPLLKKKKQKKERFLRRREVPLFHCVWPNLYSLWLWSPSDFTGNLMLKFIFIVIFKCNVSSRFLVLVLWLCHFMMGWPHVIVNVACCFWRHSISSSFLFVINPSHIYSIVCILYPKVAFSLFG